MALARQESIFTRENYDHDKESIFQNREGNPNIVKMKKAITAYALVLMLITGATHAYGEENASNPLAAVNNSDVRWQYFDLDGSERNELYLDGSYMLTPKLKLKYELHYWDTDVTGSSESDWESLHLKPI
jgi:hypothetical protein